MSAVAVLLTFAVHAGVLLLIAWAIDRPAAALGNEQRELLWRAALFGGVLSAALATFALPHLPASHWQLPVTIAADAPAPATPATAIDSSAGDRAAAPVHIASARMQVQTPGSVGVAPAPAVAAPLGARWPAWLLAAWLSGVLLALVRAGNGLRELRRTVARAVPVTDATALTDLAELAVRAGAPVPCLFADAQLPSAIALSGRRIVVPDWALGLDRAQLRAMLAHELGHLERRDPQWKLLTVFWHALLWWLPPAALAQRRLDEIAELACDAFAARHTGDGRSLAECLAHCAEHHVHGRVLEFAPAMAARHSTLLLRIDRLLEGVAMDHPRSLAGARALAALVLLGAAACLPTVGTATPAEPVAPVPPAAPAAPAAPAVSATPAVAGQPANRAATRVAGAGHSSVSIHSDDDGRDTMTISLSDDTHKFSAKVDGKIDLADDESDVRGLSAGGSATFEETRDGSRRRLDLIDHGGKLERRYYVDGDERPIDAAAQAWIASVVKQLVRSGIGAEARVKRLYASGGAARVLDEIEQIPTDYVRGVYLRTLSGLGRLTPAEADRAVKLAGAMNSDYERRQALSALFDSQAIDAGGQVTFLRQALRFNSDYERAELLVGMVPKLADTAAVRQAWLDAALKIDSDYERRRTFTAMLARNGLDDAQLASVIEASDTMQSGYEHRELLVEAIRHVHDVDAVAPAYLRSAQKISSDYERREALLALIKAGKLGAAAAAAVLDSAAQIGSSYECREVLVALARVMPDDAAVQARYREVAGRLPDYDRKEAESALRR